MDEIRVPITSDRDIITARREGRRLAVQLGLNPTEQALVATAISELARNIVQFAARGEIIVGRVEHDRMQGVEVVAIDEGPGIVDVVQAMRDGYSTSGGLGLGLPGVRRLMDDFSLESTLGVGTTVTCRKWKARSLIESG